MDTLDREQIEQRIASLTKQRPANTWWFREMRGRPRVIACEVERETERVLVLAMAGAGRVLKTSEQGRGYFPSFEEAYNDMIARREQALARAASATERTRLEEELRYLRHEYGPDGPCRLR